MSDENWQVRTLNDGSINVYDGADFIAAVGHLEGKPDVDKMRRDARLIAGAPKLAQEIGFAIANGRKWTKKDWQNWIENHAKPALALAEKES